MPASLIQKLEADAQAKHAWRSLAAKVIYYAVIDAAHPVSLNARGFRSQARAEAARAKQNARAWIASDETAELSLAWWCRFLPDVTVEQVRRALAGIDAGTIPLERLRRQFDADRRNEARWDGLD